ncbi:hypothetical protein VTJ83DRAFT_1345 [Remersonia thermophila]|uniref:Uncharacterized protein n=1 Tax=Remersonia thermophila TaxID=72144 RepID=A0ABR4DNT1_9PEZI
MRPTTALFASVLASGASAENYLGFNSGATLPDYSAKFKKDFEAEFRTAQNLENAPGTFNAVRLYTNIQAYSETDPTEAFEAAIETNTKILLGVWASGTSNIDNELTALKKAIDKFGTKFTSLVIGMSIGSEDLYRDSETGIKNKAGVGAGPNVIVKFINDYKKAVANTPLAGVPIGHVDTWDAWTNGTNKVVIDAVDWVGVDEYPYYENGKGNNIENSGQLFDRAFAAVEGAVGGKPIWITETGWPSSGPTWDLAVSSVENAKYYWDEVGCRKLFNKVPTFWYNLRDSNPDNEMKFAITSNLSTKPLFDLTCPTTFQTTATMTSALPSSTDASSTGSNGGSSSTGSSGAASSDEAIVEGSATGKAVSAVAVLGLTLVAGLFALF